MTIKEEYAELKTVVTSTDLDRSKKKGNDILKITYDAQSRPAMVKYNGTWYGYVHNLQGDIVGILDNTGAEVVKSSKQMSEQGYLAQDLYLG